MPRVLETRSATDAMLENRRTSRFKLNRARFSIKNVFPKAPKYGLAVFVSEGCDSENHDTKHTSIVFAKLSSIVNLDTTRP